MLPSGDSLDIVSMGADRHNPGTRGSTCIEDGSSDLHYRACTLPGFELRVGSREHAEAVAAAGDCLGAASESLAVQPGIRL